jgi:hypothetical protein
LALVQQNVPFDVAFSLTNNQRKAWLIAIGENEGGEFDWARFKFRERT